MNKYKFVYRNYNSAKMSSCFSAENIENSISIENSIIENIGKLYKNTI